MGVTIDPVSKNSSASKSKGATMKLNAFSNSNSNSDQKLASSNSVSVGSESESESSETTYNVTSILGQGAHGVVYLGFDFQRQKNVALKTIVLDDSSPHLHSSLKRTLRELKILRLMKHENIVQLNQVAMTHFIAENNRHSKLHLFMSLELMETDLATIIRSKQKLRNEHIQFFIYQLLRGLKFLHSANILHRDIKPSNLLVNANCDLKICDFGLARILNSRTNADKTKKGRKGKPSCTESEDSESECMTGYVETRWYRAPEVLLKNKTKLHGYGKGIDIWACGCVLAEMMLQEPIFQGDDVWEQIYLIARAVGPVPRAMLPEGRKPCNETDHSESSCCSNCRCNNAKAQIECKYKEEQQLLKFIEKAIPACSFEKRFPTKNENGIDLCKQLLTIDPKLRMDAENALQHVYIASFHCPEDEPTFANSSRKSFMSHFAFESEDVCPRELEEIIQAEVDYYTKTYGKAQVLFADGLLDHSETKYKDDEFKFTGLQQIQSNNCNLSQDSSNNNDGDIIQVCKSFEQHEEKREF